MKRKDHGRDLYVIQMAKTGDLKIGRSGDVHRRLGELQVGCPHKLKILICVPDQGHRERELHQRLRNYQNRGGRGEWFSEECVGSIPDDIWELIPEEILEDPDWWKL